jgi:GNAT superfamily N-acetyltransferase
MGAMTVERSPIRLRPMLLDDVPHSLGLFAQIGYELECREAERRFLAVAVSPVHLLLVAEAEKRIIGLLHAYGRPALEKPPEAVVQAVVVDHSFRDGGVGKALMAATERWASERGIGQCR